MTERIGARELVMGYPMMPMQMFSQFTNLLIQAVYTTLTNTDTPVDHLLTMIRIWMRRAINRVAARRRFISQGGPRYREIGRKRRRDMF